MFNISKSNTSPCRLAPMGPNFQTHVNEPLGEPHGDLWAQGPLSAAMDPCVDSYYCRIIPVWPTGHSRWDTRMGPKMGGQLDDPPDSQEGESRPQWTTFGGATSLTKPVKNPENGGRPRRTSPCRLALMGPNFQTHVYGPLGELHGDL